MLRGTLDDFTVPDVLRLLSLAHKTGVLTISGGGGRGVLYFRRGDVYHAETSTTPRSLGQKLVDEGLISGLDLDDAISRSDESGRAVADILTGTGRLTAMRLEQAVTEQIHDVAFEVMRWGSGEFSWQDALEVKPEIAASVPVDELILEAARRLDELAVQERRVVAEESIPTLSAAFASSSSPITISPDQWRILALLDGRRSARQVALLAGLDVEEALRDLYRLVTGGVVEVGLGSSPAQSPPEQPRPLAEPEIALEPSPPAPESQVAAVPPPVAPPVERRSRRRPAAPAPEEDFAAFQQAAMASAKDAPPPPVPARPKATPAIEAFDTPRPEEMTTRVPSAPRAATPPPPPPATVSRTSSGRAQPSGPAAEVADSLAGVRIDDSSSKRITAAAGGKASDEEVDPALIARLIQGVKDL